MSIFIFADCSFAISPVGEIDTQRLILIIEMTGTPIIAQTVNMNYQPENATITFRSYGSQEEQDLVNSSICQISSLEVYRGREEAIKISHQGFSLNNGSIEVYTGYINKINRMKIPNFPSLSLSLSLTW